jgi:hypothetical protein
MINISGYLLWYPQFQGASFMSSLCSNLFIGHKKREKNFLERALSREDSNKKMFQLMKK